MGSVAWFGFLYIRSSAEWLFFVFGILTGKDALAIQFCKNYPRERTFSGIIRTFVGGVSLAVVLPRRKLKQPVEKRPL
jgi:hypothetical protein